MENHNPFVGGNFSNNIPSFAIGDETYNQTLPNDEFSDDSGESGGKFYVSKQQGISDSTGDEPPLLDELGIYPKKTLKKCIGMLNPTIVVPLDNDVFGPIMMYLALNLVSLLKGRLEFEYVYLAALLGSIGFYTLLWLLADTDINKAYKATFAGVFSILGYSLQPMVLAAIIGIIMKWCGLDIQLLVTLLAFAWSVLCATRQFVLAYDLKHQQLMIAVPCVVFYAYFMLIILF